MGVDLPKSAPPLPPQGAEWSPTVAQASPSIQRYVSEHTGGMWVENPPPKGLHTQRYGYQMAIPLAARILWAGCVGNHPPLSGKGKNTTMFPHSGKPSDLHVLTVGPSPGAGVRALLHSLVSSAVLCRACYLSYGSTQQLPGVNAVSHRCRVQSHKRTST